MKYGIYFEGIRVWGGFTSEEQALKFITYYDLEKKYTIESY